MDNDKFFNVGYDGIDDELEQQKERKKKYQEGGGYGLRDFWMKIDEEDVLVRYLTEEPVVIDRHSFYVNGNWERPTCLGDEDCPYCKCPEEIVNKKRREGAHLLVDHREWETKEGNIYKDELKVGVWAASHIAGFRKDAKETEEGKLMREWKMTRTGTGPQTVYRLFPKKTEPVSEELKEAFKKVLSKFIPEWKQFKERRKLDKFPLERFAVAKTVAPLSEEEAQKLVDAYMASKGGGGGKKKDSGDKDTATKEQKQEPADLGDDEDYSF